MSKAGKGTNCSAAGSEEKDMVQYYIDKFDSDDTLTSAGAAGVDEDIIAELTKRGHVVCKQIDPMQVAIHHLNRGGVIGNTMNLDPMLENIAK